MATPEQSAQEIALREVRARYERGDLNYEEFRAAFDQALRATDAAECQALVRQLPTSPRTVLDALDRPHVPVAQRVPGSKFMLLVLGELRRTRRPWRLAQQTNGLALVGEVNLDLTLAALPQHGVLRFVLAVGEITITVPDNVSVTVQALTLLGEARALGETAEGIFAYCHDDVAGPADAPHLHIQVFGLVGEVNVRQSKTTAIAESGFPELQKG